MKKYLLPILLGGIIIGGSIFILPRFLFFGVRYYITASSPVTFREGYRGTYRWGMTELRDVQLVIDERFLLTCTCLRFTYSPWDLCISPITLNLRIEQCRIGFADSKDSLWFMHGEAVKLLTATVTFDLEKGLSFDAVDAQTPMGNMTLNGTVSRDEVLDLTGTLTLAQPVASLLQFVNAASASDSASSGAITIRVTGTSDAPFVDVSSELFQFSLQTK